MGCSTDHIKEGFFDRSPGQWRRARSRLHGGEPIDGQTSAIAGASAARGRGRLCLRYLKKDVSYQFLVKQRVVELVPRRLQAPVARAFALMVVEPLLSGPCPSTEILCKLLEIASAPRCGFVEHKRPSARTVWMLKVRDLVGLDLQHFLRSNYQSLSERTAKRLGLVLVCGSDTRRSGKNQNVRREFIAEHVRFRRTAADAAMILVPTFQLRIGQTMGSVPPAVRAKIEAIPGTATPRVSSPVCHQQIRSRSELQRNKLVRIETRLCRTSVQQVLFALEV